MIKYLFTLFIFYRTVQVAARSAALSPAEIVGSNPAEGMEICYECYVLPGTGLCDELITRPEESYRLWCIVVCDPEMSRMRRLRPELGRSATRKERFHRL